MQRNYGRRQTGVIVPAGVKDHACGHRGVSIGQGALCRRRASVRAQTGGGVPAAVAQRVENEISGIIHAVVGGVSAAVAQRA